MGKVMMTLLMGLLVLNAPLASGKEPNPQLNYKLQEAATVSLDAVKQALKDGANINSGDYAGVTALHKAAAYGKLEIIKYLLEEGADIDSKTRENATPLAWAIIRGQNKIASYLIEEGADIDNKSGLLQLDALGHASSKGNVDLIKLLLEEDADIESRNADGMTPLQVAVVAGQPEVIQILLENNANIETQDNHHITPLLSALGLSPSLKPEKQMEIIKLLIEKGANIDITTLSAAIGIGNGEAVSLLLQHDTNLKSDIQAKDSRGFTLLHQAAYLGSKDAIPPLLAEGADIKAVDANGNTPLQVAENQLSKLKNEIKGSLDTQSTQHWIDRLSATIPLLQTP